MRILPFFHSLFLASRTNRHGWPHLLALCFLLLAGTSAAHGADAFSVEAARQGDAVQIEVRATVKAPLVLIWNTLTDYDHLAEFIPGMNKSRLVERQGKTAIVEQSGFASLWFLRFPIDVTVEAVEKSGTVMSVHLLKGNLKQLEGRYEVEKTGDDDTYILHWTGVIEPGINVPGALAMPLIRKNISAQFLGMIDEIERRAALQMHNQPG